MKVVLINPPSTNEILGNNPSIIESSRGCNPPLGLLFLAGYLLHNTDHKVSVIDCQVEELDYPQLALRLKDTEFDVAGITAMTFTLLDVLETIKTIRRVNSSAKVVLGGSHVNLFPEESIRLEGVDYLVLGEGEIAFSELLDSLENNTGVENIKGIVTCEDNKITNNGPSDIIEDLDKLPFPARHLVPYRDYSSLLAKRMPITTMFTSRGCPFKCSFCNRPHLGKKFRAHSAARVIEEFQDCLNLGIHEFLIYDDTFTVNKQRVKDICRIAIENKLDIGFDIRARVDTIDEEMLILLKKAGCRGIHYGIEAGTEKILKVLNKGISLDKAKEVFDLTKKHKMQTLAYFMIGSPTETIDDINETFRVSRWLKPDFLHMTILTPFPGTPIYLDGLASGAIKTDYWREFSKNPTKEFIPPFWDENFTKEQLQELIVKGYKSFYIRPLYIVKKVFSVNSWGEFRRKAKAGLKVFTMK